MPTNRFPIPAARSSITGLSVGAVAVPAPDSAATPTEMVMAITSFETITATNSSSIRRSTPFADGHTVAAKASGDMATIT